MVGLLDIAVQAHNPSNPLYPLVAYEKSSSSLRIRNVPRQIGSWRITSVTVAAQYPDQTTRTAQCVLVGGIWVGTLQGSQDPGEGTYSVYAAGMDENNMPVNDYHLGSGQVTILEAETRRDENATVHMLYDEPTAETREGDMFQSGETSAWMIFKDGQAVPLVQNPIDPDDYYEKTETSSAAEISTGFDQLSDYYEKTETSSAAEISTAFARTKSDLAAVEQLAEAAQQSSYDAFDKADDAYNLAEAADAKTDALSAAVDAAGAKADRMETRLDRDFKVTELSGEYEDGGTFRKWFWTYEPHWFTMKNVGSEDASFVMNNVGQFLEYSTDGATWSQYSANTSLAVVPGAEVKLRYIPGSGVFAPQNLNVQGSTGKWKASGDIMTLLDVPGARTALSDGYEFQYMFGNGTDIVDVVDAGELELPATTLAPYCYANMFQGCTNLSSAPALPATTLADHCYSSMFDYCRSLTTSPVITVYGGLLSHSYDSMFANCTALSSVTTYWTWWTSGIQSNWLYNTAGNGVFRCPAELGTNDTITRGISYCPDNWTVVNI